MIMPIDYSTIVCELTRGQASALIAMLSASWTVEGTTMTSLVQLRLVDHVKGRHRLTERGKTVAAMLLAATRKAGVA